MRRRAYESSNRSARRAALFFGFGDRFFLALAALREGLCSRPLLLLLLLCWGLGLLLLLLGLTQGTGGSTSCRCDRGCLALRFFLDLTFGVFG